MTRTTVLIVDDSLTVRMDLAQALEAAGVVALPCSTIAEARATLATEEVDVVILDVLLPDGDGVEFLSEIRSASTPTAVAVMMLSSEAEIADRVRGLQTGADEYVGKPYDTGYVVAKVQQLSRDGGRHDDTTTILIIEDSMTFREELREALAADGYDVIVAHDGHDGLRMAANRRPDGVVVDGVLPDIDGSSVIRRFRLDAALRSIPCVLLTASDDQAAELRALDAGADSFVRKDDGIDVVLAKLDAVLRRVNPPPLTEDTPSMLDPKRVLAVDDSPTFLHEIADLLREEGYDAVLAHSGEEALELLAVQDVDCILLDLMMPGLGGEETCRRIKAAATLRDVPLIMLTSKEDHGTMIEVLGAGADDYVPKSSETVVLTARIRAQIRRKQFEDENRSYREELLCKEMEAAEARAQAELAETKAALVGELERKNQELEAFSYSVSHDLRAPLRSIDGFSQILLEDYGSKLDEAGVDSLERVRSSAQRMGELIDDLLTLSRISRAELHRTDVDLSTLVASIVDEITARDPQRQVKFDIHDGLIARCDERLVRAALENLIGNAWKFTAKKTDALITFGAKVDDGSTVYLVQDNGDGFDMRNAERLFHPFQRLHMESDFSGTGIGLATVHRIIDRHGGRVWAQAEKGNGATFFFTLPPTRRFWDS